MNYQSDHSKISLFWVLTDVSTSVYVYVLMDRWTGDPVLVPSSQLWSGLFWFLASLQTTSTAVILRTLYKGHNIYTRCENITASISSCSWSPGPQKLKRDELDQMARRKTEEVAMIVGFGQSSPGKDSLLKRTDTFVTL